MQVFSRYLLDHDPAVNAANWKWLAGCRYFYTYNRVYNFETFGRKHDPHCLFVKQWLPEAGSYQLQRSANPSSEYPVRPIVNLVKAKQQNMLAMDDAYAATSETFKHTIPAAAQQELDRERGCQAQIGGRHRRHPSTWKPTVHHHQGNAQEATGAEHDASTREILMHHNQGSAQGDTEAKRNVCSARRPRTGIRRVQGLCWTR